VEVRWRSLFRSTPLGKRCTSYNAPPTSWKRAADRWSLRNFLPRSSPLTVGKARKSHWGWDLVCMADVLIWFHRSNFSKLNTEFNSDLAPCDFWFFSNHEKGAPRQEIWMSSTVCSTFSRSRWSVVRSASLAKGGTSKKRQSPHLQKVPTRSNKVCPRNFQTAIIYRICIYLQRGRDSNYPFSTLVLTSAAVS
jgi:hypothetical protein